jgi:hypothetical protein
MIRGWIYWGCGITNFECRIENGNYKVELEFESLKYCGS